MSDPLWSLVARRCLATLQKLLLCTCPWKELEIPNTSTVGLSNQELISIILRSLWFLIAALLVLIDVFVGSLLSFAFVHHLGLVYFCIFAFWLLFCFSPVLFVVTEFFLPWKVRMVDLRAMGSFAWTEWAVARFQNHVPTGSGCRLCRQRALGWILALLQLCCCTLGELLHSSGL